MKKSIFLLVCFMLILLCTTALGDVIVNHSSFPDDNFLTYVQNNIDVNHNGKLSQEEIKSVVEIDLSERSITNLEGVGYFTNLDILYCDHNNLLSLDISKNKKLEKLYCGHNQLLSLDVSKNTQLFVLDCEYNNLKKIDVNNNAKLSVINCQGNKLESLDVSNNIDLHLLWCHNNQLTALNIRNNKQLTNLVCDSNKLTKLDVSKNKKVESISCESNMLTTLDVSKNIKLEYLHCGFNELSALNLTKNNMLIQLYCNDNHINSLNLTGNPYLVNLKCNNNLIKKLDVSKCKDLCELVKKHKRKHHAKIVGADYIFFDDFLFDRTVTIIAKNITSKPLSNSISTVKGLQYFLNSKNKTAVFIGPKNKKSTSITIPATIKVKENIYKVTEIEANACSELKDLSKVTIGKNVAKIGKNAFSGCAKLKTIIIKSTLLTKKNVKSGAFKGINSKATIKCPKSKAKDYKKFLPGKGVPKTAKIK